MENGLGTLSSILTMDWFYFDHVFGRLYFFTLYFIELTRRYRPPINTIIIPPPLKLFNDRPNGRVGSLAISITITPIIKTIIRI